MAGCLVPGGRRGCLVCKYTGSSAGKSDKLPCPGVRFLKMIPCPRANVLNIMSLRFCEQNCAVPWKFVKDLSENAEILLSKRIKSYSRSAIVQQRLFEVKDDSMDPVMEPIFTKMVPYSGVKIFKMILCSVVRPRTENI